MLALMLKVSYISKTIGKGVLSAWAAVRVEGADQKTMVRVEVAPGVVDALLLGRGDL